MRRFVRELLSNCGELMCVHIDKEIEAARENGAENQKAEDRHEIAELNRQLREADLQNQLLRQQINELMNPGGRQRDNNGR